MELGIAGVGGALHCTALCLGSFVRSFVRGSLIGCGGLFFFYRATETTSTLPGTGQLDV
ncbi:hypothetical protein P167DRAFT_534950 [Morchella conica CCBAS932]|uniref:Uncharacterized protein n=1 Tax=Morchella conica CCBAS932 TaxID=1392247 RepID=A0A3N4KSY6_9PEZI|nr:hypothetical protein P167DRAFT_534950 [Morchella conica CCBAS932]